MPKNKVKTRVKKTRTNKQKKQDISEEDVAVAVEVSENPTQESTHETKETKPRKKRVVPTRESVGDDFDKVLGTIDAEITKIKESDGKNVGVRFLRGVAKRLKVLKSQTLRLTKKKNTRKAGNANSGFLKPVKITKDLLKFAGWEKDSMHSRNEVTKFLCDYIRKNALQDEKDRRIILIDNDPKLAKLIKYNPDDFDGKPMNYCRLQKCLGKFFIKK